MTILAVRPVAFPTMTDQPRPLGSAEVGALIGDGVTGRTVNVYRRLSKPGERYADNPFPEPRGYVGDRPYWMPDQIPAIRAWDAARLGTGSGATGRPRSKQ